jgi:3-hydroxyisobutyrate dehydrogenase
MAEGSTLRSLATPAKELRRATAAKNTAPLLTIDLIEKDLGYILATAKASGAELPGAESARAAFQQAQKRGLGQANVSGLAAVFA